MINASQPVNTEVGKGLIDIIILQLLRTQSMHIYQPITQLRDSFGIYFRPNVICPMLTTLEGSGVIESIHVNNSRPRKVYRKTCGGKNILSYTETSLQLICKKLNA